MTEDERAAMFDQLRDGIKADGSRLKKYIRAIAEMSLAAHAALDLIPPDASASAGEEPAAAAAARWLMIHRRLQRVIATGKVAFEEDAI